MPYHLYQHKFCIPTSLALYATGEKKVGFNFKGRPLFLVNRDFTCMLDGSLCSRYLWAWPRFPLLWMAEASVAVLFLPGAVRATWTPVARTLSASSAAPAGRAYHQEETIERLRPVVTTRSPAMALFYNCLSLERALGPVRFCFPCLISSFLKHVRSFR